MKKGLIVLLGILITFSITNAASNRCSFSNFEHTGNNRDIITVEINIANEDTLGGFQIPFSFEDENVDMVCDSINFIDSRCGHFDLLDSSIDNTAKSAMIMGIYQTNPAADKEPLLPGQGLIAKAYFTITNINDRPDPRERDGRHVRFFCKNFTMSNNGGMVFSFWNTNGESVDAVFENNVNKLEPRN